MKNYGKVVGYFFIVFGGYSLVAALIDAFANNIFRPSLAGPLLFIWIGWGLLQNKNSYRIGSIIICSITLLGILASLITSLFRGTVGVQMAFFKLFEAPSILVHSLYIVTFGGILFVLLHPKIKKHYL